MMASFQGILPLLANVQASKFNFWWCIPSVLLYLFVSQVISLSILEHTINPKVASYCSPVTLTCRVNSVSSDIEVWWMFRGENILLLPNITIITNDTKQGVWQLQLKCPTLENNGSYSCNAHVENKSEVIYRKEVALRIHIPVTIKITNSIKRQLLGGKVNLTCLVLGHPLPVVKWYKGIHFINNNNSKYLPHINHINSTTQLAFLQIDNLLPDDNGTYFCQAENEFTAAKSTQDLFVEEPPVIGFLKSNITIENSRSVILKWHIIFDGNSRIDRYHLDRKCPPTANYSIVDHDIHENVTKYAVKGLLPGLTYTFQISAVNSAGKSAYDYVNVSIPADVPSKVTWVHLLSSTSEKLLFGWKRPLQDNGENITHYAVKLHHENGSEIDKKEIKVTDPTTNNYIHTFSGLNPAEKYFLEVQACNTIGCSLWSKSVGITSDGIADPPSNVVATCEQDTVEGRDVLTVTWEAPVNARGTILSYDLFLYSKIKYRNVGGQIVEDKSHRKEIINANSIRMEYKTIVLPNTEYTTRICAQNRSGCGKMTNITTKTQCKTNTNIPSTFPKFTIKKENSSNSHEQMVLHLQRVDERNGSILCYKIVMIRLSKGKNVTDLPANPQVSKLLAYNENDAKAGYTAYIADAFSSSNFTSVVIIGDNHQQNSCNSTLIFYKESSKYKKLEQNKDVFEFGILQDRTLSPDTNYTGYVLIEVQGPNDTILTKASSYFPIILTAAPLPVISTKSIFIIVVEVLSVITLFVLLFAIFIYHKRYKYRPGYFRTLRRSGLVASIMLRSFRRKGHLPERLKRLSRVPRLSPLAANNLPIAFAHRHADRDLLFQSEFEALPVSFKDRTTLASDAPENINKNRNPNIKAYDQTRVKLAKNSLGYDYINANFIEGYKGRKRFICAQGPVETTVEDFWRMIWEYRVTVVVMLTDIEENGQGECSQYWNDTHTKQIESTFLVTVTSMKQYSGYVARKFRLRKATDGFREAREVWHFHFVPWADCLDPEQPSWMLCFVKTVNEYYCSSRGPMLVHCCAGVGHSGTFIAIDNILEQLEEEDNVDIFSQVKTLRHQRNHLVQSLRQYVFVYRAITEQAMFGNTEVDAWHLREHYEVIKRNVFCAEKTALANEFERLSDVIEDPKTFSEGTKEANVNKNRYSFIIPYDFNRVILEPLSADDSPSYINASLIHGYDRSSSFIITQDPLESTFCEFWRMIMEQNVSSLVALSEIGEGQTKCQQYWPKEENVRKVFDCMEVTLVNSKELPFYIKRVFTVMSSNSPNMHTVTQFHLKEWPFSSDVAPTSTHDLMTLIEDVQNNEEQQGLEAGPITVHCSGGGDRSSVFVTLSSLLLQLKVDEKVDVFQSAKYTRLQRQCMLQTFPLYDLLYRGLLEYIASRNMYDLRDLQL